MKRIVPLLLAAAAAAVVFVAVSGSASAPMTLTVTPRTATTVTLSWPPQNVDGFDFILDSVRVSTTLDGTRTSTTAKKSTTYRVDGWQKQVVVSGVSPAPVTPPPPSGDVKLSGTMTPSAVLAALGTNRPVTASGPVTISGDFNVPSGVTLVSATVLGHISLGTGSTFSAGSAYGFDVTSGADNWTISSSVFDGRGIDNQNLIWDASGGNGSSGWKIVGSTFRNYYVAADPSAHAEALYVGGYSANGLIEGNTFTTNGNTAHIFFTWFGNTADPSRSWPRDICVRNNVFNQTWTAYFSIDWRSEIPATANIRIDPSNRQVGTQALTSRPEFNAAC